MSKWIAEFELEDGDTMPEHMDLEYKGVRIDFHCKPQEPCDDCINRKAVLEIYDEWFATCNIADKKDSPKIKINALSSVTPIRPKGHWIENAEEYYKAINEKGGGVNDNTPYFVDDIACSECLAKFCIVENEVERFDFCPNCGADMRGEE